MSDIIIAVTGHRPNKLGGYGQSVIQTKVRKQLERLLVGLCPDRAISGMALGVDQWFAETCIRFGIPFDAYVPCQGHSSRWPLSSVRHYDHLLSKARSVRVITDAPYSAAAMQWRNQAMVDDATQIIAVWDGTSGGTGNCVRYAEQRNVPIIRITPSELV